MSVLWGGALKGVSRGIYWEGWLWLAVLNNMHYRRARAANTRSESWVAVLKLNTTLVFWKVLEN